MNKIKTPVKLEKEFKGYCFGCLPVVAYNEVITDADGKPIVAGKEIEHLKEIVDLINRQGSAKGMG